MIKILQNIIRREKNIQMNNFEYEVETDDNIVYNKEKIQAMKEETQLQNKVQDELDIQMCGLTFAFKAVTILMYLVLRLVADSYIGVFVSAVVAMSLDFWSTKNLTGRALVGLRWWSQINEDGEEEWLFECNRRRQSHKLNAGVFWGSQISIILFWFIILFINIITFNFFLTSLSLFCLLLSTINFLCFFKCKGQHRHHAQQITSKIGMNGVSEMIQ